MSGGRSQGELARRDVEGPNVDGPKVACRRIEKVEVLKVDRSEDLNALSGLYRGTPQNIFQGHN